MHRERFHLASTVVNLEFESPLLHHHLEPVSVHSTSRISVSVKAILSRFWFP